jgi:hypothetical protein
MCVPTCLGKMMVYIYIYIHGKKFRFSYRMQGPGATSGKNNADCEGEHDQSSNFLRTKRFFVICQYLRLSFCLSQAWLGKMFVF